MFPLSASPPIDATALWLGQHALAIWLGLLLGILLLLEAGWQLLRGSRLQPARARLDGWRLRVLAHRQMERMRRRFPRAWRLAEARFAPDEWLGLHLTLGLLLTGGMLAVFGALASAVTERASITEFDQRLAFALRANGSIHWVTFFRWLTHGGDSPTLTVLGVAIGLVLLRSRRWLWLTAWAMALTGAGLLNTLLKEIFRRVRPILTDPWQTAPGWSFPSGHAMSSLVAYGMLAYLLTVLWRVPLPRLIIAATVALVLTIGFSRIYLGVHFFSDVLGGYAAAAFWLGICISTCETARRRPRANVAATINAPAE